jgi:hypothetical protein
MHPNAVYQKVFAALTESEAKTAARLDAIEVKIDKLLACGGKPAADEPAPSKAVQS